MFFEVKKYIPKKHIFDIINFFKEHKINFNLKNFISYKTLKLKIHNEILYGGNDDSKKIKINLRNNKYEARIYEYNDGYLKTINFIKVHSIFNDNIDDFNEDDSCGILIIDKENNAVIQSINNYTDCLKCINSKEKIKIGEVLIQIMIGICVYKDVDKVQLTDNSYLECGNEKIPLIYLRTLTKGEPYYIKFGFLPINHNKKGDRIKNEYYKNELQIYKDNIDIFNNKPIIKRNKLIKILNYKKFDEIKDKNMIEYVNNIIIPSLNDENILISKFVSDLIKDKKKISCYLLNYILMNIYNKCGYNRYKYKYFEFILDKKYKDIVKTHIQINN